ncbi:hypothetical protein ILUMI_14343 [Ignelater luminosus]|uniref:Uncharacterized protein n=1 Tax=Ignelater luminosus TaxID=2038154 RepID=A0A8K0CQN0_IGNLU|nr:hypothetical protein ILUMI_14343 [Ignelater luminosus]
MSSANAHRRTPRQRADSSHQFIRWYANEKDNLLDSIFTGKVMATVFWVQKRVLLVDVMAPGITINADSIVRHSEKLRRAIPNRKRGMLSKRRRPHGHRSPATDRIEHHHPPYL